MPSGTGRHLDLSEALRAKASAHRRNVAENRSPAPRTDDAVLTGFQDCACSARAPMFADEDQQAKLTRDPIAPAKRSRAAERKATTHTLDNGEAAHSFVTLIAELSTVVRNTCRTPSSNPHPASGAGILAHGGSAAVQQTELCYGHRAAEERNRSLSAARRVSRFGPSIAFAFSVTSLGVPAGAVRRVRRFPGERRSPPASRLVVSARVRRPRVCRSI